MSGVRLTVILPMHNEEERIRKCVRRVKKACERITKSYEIIIAEDGSSDRTYEIAKELSQEDGRIRVLHSKSRLGRGRALTKALGMARGKISVYIDADLSSNLRYLGKLIRSVESGAVVATGSRLVKGAKTKRSMKREIASRGFNFLVRMLLGSKIMDHQCGFKAFHTSEIKKLLKEVEDTHWFWDTEVLVRAQRKGWKVVEFPIKWEEKGKSTVDMKKDILYMGGRILELRKKLRG